MTRNQLEKAITRERNKLQRQEDAVEATKAMIATLEHMLKTAK